MNPIERRSLTAIGLALAALAVAACNQNPTGAPSSAAAQASSLPPPLPLTTADAPPLAPAPSASDLPPTQPASMAYLEDPLQQYAFEDRATNLARVLADAPPDYDFDFGGTQPWVWRGDGFVRVMELTPDGDRYYYYDAGSSSPYLIQDADYAYAFADGGLVAIYGPDGRALPGSDAQYRLDVAGRYLARSRALYSAALASQRRAVALDSWRRQSAAIDEDRARWEQEQTRLSDWRAYHDAHQSEDEAYWQGESARRQAEAQSYRQVLGNQGATPAVAVLAAAAAAYGATHAGAPGDRPRPPLAPQNSAPRGQGAGHPNDQHSVGQGAPVAGPRDARQPGPQEPNAPAPQGPPHEPPRSVGGSPQPGPEVGDHHDHAANALAAGPPAASPPTHDAPGARTQDHRQTRPQGSASPPTLHGPLAQQSPVVHPTAQPRRPDPGPAGSGPFKAPPPPAPSPAPHASPPPPRPAGAATRHGPDHPAAPAAPSTPPAKDKRPANGPKRPDHPG